MFRGELGRIKDALKKSFEKIKDEFDEHRETINQNTNEIQANYEYLCRLDSKIEKLAERIDEISMFMSLKAPDKSYHVSNLTTREKEVFLTLYSSDGLGYEDIARRTGLTENLVICYISNIIAKGVPVTKKYVDKGVLLDIEPGFKEIQMKENIVGINDSVSQRVTV